MSIPGFIQTPGLAAVVLLLTIHYSLFTIHFTVAPTIRYLPNHSLFTAFLSPARPPGPRMGTAIALGFPWALRRQGQGDGTAAGGIQQAHPRSPEAGDHFRVRQTEAVA